MLWEPEKEFRDKKDNLENKNTFWFLLFVQDLPESFLALKCTLIYKPKSHRTINIDQNL